MSAFQHAVTHSTEVETISKQAWWVCITAGLFFFYEFIQMNMINSLSPSLMQAFHIHATDLGLLNSRYFLANAIFLLPAGQLLDRFSTRKIILISMLVCILGTLGFALANSLTIASIFRFFTGIGSAFCFLSCIRLASRWFPSRRMALISGLVVTMAMMGGWVAQNPMTHVINAVGWRNAVLLDAALGVLILAVIFKFVRDYPTEQAQQAAEHRKHLSSLGYWRSLWTAYTRKQNWLGGTYTCLINLPVFLMGASWGGLYLQQILHFTPAQASSITGMVFFGTVFGSPLAGWVSDKMGRRKLPMLIGAVLSLALMSIIIYGNITNFAVLIVLFFLLGLITSSQVISYPTVAESNPIALTATSVSVVSFTTIGIGGAVLIPLFGKLMDWKWNHLVVDNVAIYSVSDYQRGLLIIPIAFIIAFIAACFIRETYCRKEDGIK